MGWELLGAAIGGGFIGGVVAAIIQWVRKLKTLPMWPVLTGAILFMLSAAVRASQLSN